MARALIIPFPMHRVRRRRASASNVFRALGDEAALDRAELRLLWASTAIVTLLGTALQLTFG